MKQELARLKEENKKLQEISLGYVSLVNKLNKDATKNCITILDLKDCIKQADELADSIKDMAHCYVDSIETGFRLQQKALTALNIYIKERAITKHIYG